MTTTAVNPMNVPHESWNKDGKVLYNPMDDTFSCVHRGFRDDVGACVECHTLVIEAVKRGEI